MGLGLYGNGMHDFVLRELEIGFRAAVTEDAEVHAWWGIVPPAILDLQYEEFMKWVE